MRRFCLTFLFLFVSLSTNVFCQELKKNNIKSSVTKNKVDFKKSERTHPRVSLLKRVEKEEQKAMLWSILVPCGGQIYNKTYWTAGGLASLYAVVGGTTWYWHNRYLEAGMFRIDNPDSDNRGEVKNCERFRTMGLIGLGVIYIFGVIEAYSSASMKTFDISDDLSFVVEPKVNDNEAGINLGLNFK